LDPTSPIACPHKDDFQQFIDEQKLTSQSHSCPADLCLADFEQVLDQMKHNERRITECVNIATLLMSIHEAGLAVEQRDISMVRNASLTFLTGITAILLPFSTIAAIMAIPGDTGLQPGGKQYWIFWVSGTVAMIMGLFGYLVVRYGMPVIKYRAKPSTTGNEPEKEVKRNPEEVHGIRSRMKWTYREAGNLPLWNDQA
jgi:hypothetical protein